MPSFTSAADDTPSESRSRNPNPKPPPPPPPNSTASHVRSIPPRPPHFACPTLYATPEVTPLPDSPAASFSPSPYVINHKRRGPRLGRSSSDSGPRPPSAEATSAAPTVEGEPNGSGNLEGDIAAAATAAMTALDVEVKSNAAADQDSMTSNSEMDERLGKTPATPIGPMFYDAVEEISCDGAKRSSSTKNVEDELHEMRLNLLTEIEKRKRSDDSLENLQRQWQNLGHQLSLVGWTLPAISTTTQQSPDPAEELCQQVVISRIVAGSFGSACARAEVEMEMESQIESKNFEIARLGDRLQYYEAANREMSQRNQEAVEMARQQRLRRKRRQKWLLGSIGLAATLGASAIAWYYVPDLKASLHFEGETSTSHSE